MIFDLEELETGDILHCSSDRLIGKLIRKFTKSTFSHSAIFISIWGCPYVIEAQNNGVNVKPWDEWIKKYDYKFVVTRNPLLNNETQFAVNAMTKVGLTAYDFEGLLLRQPWYLITGKWRNRGNKESNKMYCSEYVAWAHGIEDYFKMSPESLWEFSKNNHTLITTKWK